MTRARDVANLIGSGNYSSTTFTATAGQTAFTISHTQGFIQVFMNGLLLDETVDYTSNGSAVTLTSGAAAGDEIEVVAYNTFSVGDALNQAAADTRYVNATGDTMSGDLTIDTNTFHVDVADNRVGIGTTTPVHDLQIHKATASSQARIQMTTNESGTTNGDGYAVAMEAGNRVYHWLYENAPMQFATNNTLNMVINANGSVTKPNQPFFDAYMSANYTTGSSGVYNISTSASWGAHVNTGSHFNASNGTFTAPIAGRYLFYAGLGVQSYPTSAYLSCEFEVNGSRKYIHWFSNYGTSYAAANNTTVINLNASDYVRLVSETHQSATYIGTGSGIYNHFGGYLLG